MRPSQYNYLKRMWTRNLARKKQQKIRLKKRKRKERRERLKVRYQDFIRAQNTYEIQDKYVKKGTAIKVKKNRTYYKYIFIFWTLYTLYSFSEINKQIGIGPGIIVYVFGVLIFCSPFYLYYILRGSSKKDSHCNLLLWILKDSHASEKIASTIKNILDFFNLKNKETTSEPDGKTDEETKDSDSTNNTQKSHTNNDILIYAAMCERHAREREYMEKLGINPDDYETHNPEINKKIAEKGTL